MTTAEEIKRLLLDAVEAGWNCGFEGKPQRLAQPEVNTVCEAIDSMAAELEQTKAALVKANDQAERFEREWYLRGDQLESMAAELTEAKRQLESYKQAYSYLVDKL